MQRLFRASSACAAILLALAVIQDQAHGQYSSYYYGDAVDAGCGCGADVDPGCHVGCSDDCCCHQSYACKKWDNCNGCGPRLCGCVGPTHCMEPCGCGCSSTVGCGDACGYEPACGCVDDCGDCSHGGCGDSCHGGCHNGMGVRGCLGSVARAIYQSLGGCTGCSCEYYWSEWHNDPPLCCDPCDRCGNWIGPGAGGYRAPYAHAHLPDEYGYAGPEYVSSRQTGPTRSRTAQNQRRSISSQFRR